LAFGLFVGTGGCDPFWSLRGVVTPNARVTVDCSGWRRAVAVRDGRVDVSEPGLLSASCVVEVEAPAAATRRLPVGDVCKHWLLGGCTHVELTP
jgi:hypothetical protein